MECGGGWKTLQDSALSSSTPAPTLLEWPLQEQRESGLTASAPVSDVTAPACTNGAYGLCAPWAWRRITNRWSCCPPVSNPSTSPWTARPDGSGRWDNRMAAQHLPEDLVRPRCEQQQLAQRTKKTPACVGTWTLGLPYNGKRLSSRSMRWKARVCTLWTRQPSATNLPIPSSSCTPAQCNKRMKLQRQ